MAGVRIQEVLDGSGDDSMEKFPRTRRRTYLAMDNDVMNDELGVGHCNSIGRK